MKEFQDVISINKDKIIIDGSNFNGDLNIEIRNIKKGIVSMFSSNADLDIQTIKGNINITNVNGNLEIEGADNVQLDSAFSLVASSIKDEIEIDGEHIFGSKINKELEELTSEENGWD